MQSTCWQFWIDVGGTFTDCYAVSPSDEVVRHKLLSTGVTKGVADTVLNARSLIDRERMKDPRAFWVGYRLRVMDGQGAMLGESLVVGFDRATGELQMGDPILVDGVAGQRYELLSDEEAPVVAVRYIMGLTRDASIPAHVMRLGTTRGTNALLTRSGARVGFVTTRGFADILRIGNQDRPHLFRLSIEKPPALFSDVVEIHERIDGQGNVLLPLDLEATRVQLEKLLRRGVESLAICLMNSYACAEHERAVEKLARELGFTEVSVSYQLSPLVKLVARGDTTVVDAYLNPVLRTYIAGLRQSLGVDSDLRLMTSSGGLCDVQSFCGKDSIFSGPAGGVVGFARAAQAAGFSKAIGFDMGGTSTDVSRFDGEFELEHETEKAGVRVVAPMLSIETVAAGGGSICWFDGTKLVVGPQSAGADPGPACYGRGGPLAVTDVNYFLGRLPQTSFPFPLDRVAVEARLCEIQGAIEQAMGKRLGLRELAEGFLQVANAKMAEAIRSISIAKGYDPREYVLVAFGGAAAQHACAVADELGMQAILNHPDAGILSALGMGLASVTKHRAVGVYQRLCPETLDELAPQVQQLTNEAIAEVVSQGVRPEQVQTRIALDLRYEGTDAPLTVFQPQDSNYAAQFAREHQRLYGYVHDQRAIEVVTCRVEAVGHATHQLAASHELAPSQQYDGLLERPRLRPGDRIVAPATVVESHATTIVDAGWCGSVLSGGELLLTKAAPKAAGERAGQGGGVVPRDSRETAVRGEVDPILLEIFNHRFAAIAEQMGTTLRHTSSSVNVKERLDYSCALFTTDGALVVNAPHIPVHLGAMAETVRCVIADNPNMAAGDVFVTNDPYRGGSHLPDVTVVTPVFDATGTELLFHVASRAHHAEIGGITPGSMPPDSTCLAEEGVLLRNVKAIDAGRSCLAVLRTLLESSPYPSRAVETNLADIAAQIAANQRGARDLLKLVERYGFPVVRNYMMFIQQAAEKKTRLALEALSPGKRRFVDHLDDGSPICVELTVSQGAMQIDFTGTGPVVRGNLNANRAIVTAAVMYVMRLLIDEELPLNQGILRPVTLVLPECLLNPPDRGDAKQCAAVVGGNVETSQRVVDVLLGALGIAAASQGTMNNLLFGDHSFGYYETICGGAGATALGPGADAIHTHMTNTRLTDPEVMEQRLPIRVQEFSIRRDSGGHGLHVGGCGVVRRIEFLRELELSILSQRRGDYLPYGSAGGSTGKSGRNTIQRRDGSRQQLPGQVELHVFPGDVICIETPGGGGWGVAEEVTAIPSSQQG